MRLIRLLLADDHPDVLAQLASRFRREPGIELVGQAENSAQAIALSLAEKPDVLLIDPIMRDRLGLNALKQIIRRCPSTQLIVLTAVVDTALQIELRKLGVSQILIKGLETSQLLQTIQNAGPNV